ncbi:MAG: pyridoxal phosphate-dependent aminotransferase [Mycobacterium sp.]
MAEPALASPDAAEILGALPHAVDPLALSLNENPFPPLRAVRKALIKSIGSANRYPEFLPERLRRIIAGHIGVPEEQIVLGAGATGVVMQVLQAVTNLGDTIAMTSPTFDGYPIVAQIARLMPEIVPLNEHGHHDLDALADAAANARVVVLCRPHNPTGTLESVAEVVRFLRRIPQDTIVLLDEAYVEFVAPEHRIDAAAVVARFPNVVVVRTFSKAYGLAGLRIGYGLGSSDLTKALWTKQLPFGMASTGLRAVAASYAAESQLLKRVRLITAERRYLQKHLSAMGVYSTDAHANFVYLPPRGRPWHEVLASSGLQVRYYARGGARVTIGGRASSLAVLSAVEKELDGIPRCI